MPPWCIHGNSHKPLVLLWVNLVVLLNELSRTHLPTRDLHRNNPHAHNCKYCNCFPECTYTPSHCTLYLHTAPCTLKPHLVPSHPPCTLTPTLYPHTAPCTLTPHLVPSHPPCTLTPHLVPSHHTLYPHTHLVPSHHTLYPHTAPCTLTPHLVPSHPPCTLAPHCTTTSHLAPSHHTLHPHTTPCTLTSHLTCPHTTPNTLTAHVTHTHTCTNSSRTLIAHFTQAPNSSENYLILESCGLSNERVLLRSELLKVLLERGQFLLQCLGLPLSCRQLQCRAQIRQPNRGQQQTPPTTSQWCCETHTTHHPSVVL